MLKHWYAKFSSDGRLVEVKEVPGAPASGFTVLIVKAETLQEAQRVAVRKYAARKKKEAKLRRYAEGRCACGRTQDIAHPDGGFYKRCSVCKERQDVVYRPQYNQRMKDGTVGQIPRDEAARVEKNLERQRDRRAEIRLEVLLEVRNQWIKHPNVGSFGKWLEKEIETVIKSQ